MSDKKGSVKKLSRIDVIDVNVFELKMQSLKLTSFFRYVFFGMVASIGMLGSMLVYSITEHFAALLCFAAFVIISFVCSCGKAWIICKMAWGNK